MKPVPLMFVKSVAVLPVAIGVAALLVPATLRAQSSEPKSTSSTVAPRPTGEARPPAGELRISNRVMVGEDAPDFELSDSNGRTFRLSQMRGRRVLLNFADRRVLLSPFTEVAESLRTMGVTLVGVCHDSPQSLRTLAERDGVSYPMLSDPTGEISAIYGAYDYLGSSIVPGFVLVGPRGKVRMVFLGESLPPAELLELTRYTLNGL